VTRLARVAPAAAIPDLGAQILAAAGWARPRRYAVGAARVALVLLGLAQVALAAPALALGADGLHAPLHAAHESGAWNLALAVAFLAAAVRPRYAAGLLPLLGAFVAVLVVVGLPDLAAGAVPLARLAGHLPAVAALLLVAVLARAARRPRVPPRRGRSVAGDGVVGDGVVGDGVVGDGVVGDGVVGDSGHLAPAPRQSSGDGAENGPAAAAGHAGQGHAGQGYVGQEFAA
jgi:predicted anti-sigma-YlaC factor YlaD